MRRTALVAVLMASVTLAAQEPQQPPPQTPTFRTGIELITVDVAVSDERGRPVTDLRAPDFEVKIDGQVRRVVSAEHVRIDVEAARQQAQAEAEVETFFTSNLTPPNGRMIVIAVDQAHIRPGAARPMLASAARFLDRLSPADRVAFVAYPQPGVAIDFTNDHMRIRRAMQRITGSQMRHKGRFNLGLYEAKAIAETRDEITRRAVVERECGLMQGAELERCERDVELEAGDIVTSLRVDTTLSLEALRRLLGDLAAIEGQKSLILISEGLILDGIGGELEDVVRLAMLGRVSINVLLMDVPRFEVTQSQLPPTATEDRAMQVEGLQNLAGMSRGALYQVIGSGDAIFDRLASELSAYYLLGVEQAASDRDGKRHRIDVEVRRRNVSVRSRRAFVLSQATGGRTTPQDRLITALKTPFAVAELPMRVTTYSYQDPASSKVRVVMAADVGQTGAKAGEYTVGFVLIDDEGNVASSGQEKRRLEPIDGRSDAALGFVATMTVEPGTYSLRLAAVDEEGRRGSVVRPVHAWKIAGEEFAVGDLMLGALPESNKPVIPQVEPRVQGGVLAAYVEMYADNPAGLDDASVVIEIADDEDAPPLTMGAAQIGNGPKPGIRVARGVVPARLLPPGRYLARARITRGGQPAGVLARPFVLDSTPRGTLEEGATVVVPASLVASLAAFDTATVLKADIVSTMIDLAQQASPALKDAVAEARAGRYGAAALDALGNGDQSAAAFFKGLDLLTKGQIQEAATQLHAAAGPRREYFPAAFYLGACFAAAGRDRDAAGVWQLALGGAPRPPVAYILFADARLREGQPTSVVDVLRPVFERMPDNEQIAKRLAVAYVMSGHYAEAMPVLDAYLAKYPSDPDVLFSAIMAQYEVASRAQVPLSDVERAKVTRWARAYKGPQQALVSKYLSALDIR